MRWPRTFNVAPTPHCRCIFHAACAPVLKQHLRLLQGKKVHFSHSIQTGDDDAVYRSQILLPKKGIT
jgi:hypothetical protein